MEDRASASSGGFTLTASSPVNAVQGGSATVVVDISRTGSFSGDVTFAAEDLPADVTATFTPATSGGANTSLALGVGAGAAVGTSSVLVRGTASGLPDATVSFDLTITAPSASSDFTYDYSTCPLDEQPVWVATQDGAGSGTWTRVTGSGGVFEFSVSDRQDAIYTKDELVVDDDGKPQKLPWEDWRPGEDDNTSAWMRATSPSGAAEYVGKVALGQWPVD